MNGFRRIAAIVISVLAAMSVSLSATETAAQIISRCADKVNNAPSLTINFSLSHGTSNQKCTLIVSREKFVLDTPTMKVWYDGVTQWTYDKTSKELSLTEPYEDELLECNPFIILNFYNRAYSCRRLGGDGTQIEMVATKSGATIRKAAITIDDATSLPAKMIVTMSSGQTFVISISQSSIGKSLPTSTFVYDKARYPALTTNDLR